MWQVFRCTDQRLWPLSPLWSPPLESLPAAVWFGGAEHWLSMTIWPGSQVIVFGSASALGAPIAADAASAAAASRNVADRAAGTFMARFFLFIRRWLDCRHAARHSSPFRALHRAFPVHVESMLW